MHALTSGSGGVVLAAYSGGADSLALLLHLRSRGLPVVAGIVDHALRDGSDSDAAQAARRAEALGVPARVVRLQWQGAPVVGQARARQARHAALAQLARECEATTIALGHTMSDLAETIVMRVRAGSGWRGLAPMPARSPAPLWPIGRGLWVERPLINRTRAELRSDLRAQGLDWIEDPSNEQSKFERVRVRTELGDGDLSRFKRLSDLVARRSAHVDKSSAALLAEFCVFDGGRCVVAAAALSEQRSPLAQARLAAVLTTAVSGAKRVLPDRHAWALLRRLCESGAAAAHGVVWRRRGGTFEVTRDRGALFGRRGGGEPLGPLPLALHVDQIWDGRLTVRAQACGASLAPDPQRRDGGPRVQVGNLPWLSLEQARSTGVLEYSWLLAERARSLLWRAF